MMVFAPFKASRALCLRQARLHEIESVAVEDCRVSEGICQPDGPL